MLSAVSHYVLLLAICSLYTLENVGYVFARCEVKKTDDLKPVWYTHKINIGKCLPKVSALVDLVVMCSANV